ncbi:hypothetical protein DRQ36_00500 [bacterium]|nr:MAG: hypothetical protein DRQ36_00500 [bacterium]
MRKFIILAILTMLVGAIVIGIACTNSTDIPVEPQNPDVPPVSSMRICMTTFPSMERARVAEHCEHFEAAFVIVTVWVTITEAAFLIPRLVFALALTQTPEYEGDSTWCWTLGVDTNNVKLYAQLLPTDSVDWAMHVTNNELDDFLWYTGRCDFHATGGWWEFYDPNLPADSNTVIFADWEKDTDDTTAHFTIVNENIYDVDGAGDTLRYQLYGTIAEVVVHDVCGAQVERWTINWDINDGFGRIIYPDYSEGCWDEWLECIDCDSLSFPTY